MTRLPPPQSLVADPFFPRLKSLVIDTTGMAFYLDKDEDLARIVQERLAQLGLQGCAQYLELLTAANAAAAEEMDALVAELTIGETYFFRHKEQFDALRDIILPDVLDRNQASRRLRIWSAGCATGPEPYSLAIMLKREFGVRIAGWHISIVGTDINQKFLARAREGRYDEWAFRTMPDAIRAECFDKVGRQWQIRPEFKAFVSFQYHNLIKNRFPSLLDNIAGFDIIICRNVIIYFSRETIEELIPSFRETLVEGGWLVMGHAEPNQELFRDFRTINTPGAVLYQKAPPASAEPPRPVVAAPVPPAPSAVVLPFPKAPPPRPRPRPAAPPAASSVAAPRPVPPPSGLAEVRELADRGQWEQAASCCDALLAVSTMDARVHFYRAMIHEQMGELESAEKALRRAIYLDRHFVLPHYHLGLFLLRRDDTVGASRSFRNVLSLLDRLDDAQAIVDGDDITGGQLRETVEMHLRLIGGS
ncbi:MAG: CheR family methyltransferase [Actinomycetota bacterium]